MFKPIPEDDTAPAVHKRQHRAAKRRSRRLKRIQMLPTLLTLANLYFGFAAIYFCCLEMRDLGAGIEAAQRRTLNNDFFETVAPSYLSVAVWMIALGAICDALDGRVARKTGASSKFGEQLDSLADIVSFGLVPALMMVILVRREFAPITGNASPFGIESFGQLAFFMSAVYVCCAGLRLARFSVEVGNTQDTNHEGFAGLPTPGAASGVASLVFLHDHLIMNWENAAYMISVALPVVTLLVALLMVSRVQYTHFVHLLLRRRPFGHAILAVLALTLVLLYTEMVAVICAWAYISTGLVGTLLMRWRGKNSGDRGIAEDHISVDDDDVSWKKQA